MPTFRECFEELQARRARLKEAEDRGWRDCVASERQNVEEFEAVFTRLMEGNMDKLLDVAGDVHLGALPLGSSMAFSQEYEWVDTVPGTSSPSKVD